MRKGGDLQKSGTRAMPKPRRRSARAAQKKKNKDRKGKKKKGRKKREPTMRRGYTRKSFEKTHMKFPLHEVPVPVAGAAVVPEPFDLTPSPGEPDGPTRPDSSANPIEVGSPRTPSTRFSVKITHQLSSQPERKQKDGKEDRDKDRMERRDEGKDG
jgi:hypothetical protein